MKLVKAHRLYHRAPAVLGGALLLLVALLGAPLTAAEEAGKKEFVSQGCNKCHSVASHEIEATVKSEKMKGPDMSEVGSRHDAAWMTKFVNKEVEQEGQKHKGKFEGNQKQLGVIVAWLTEQKKK